MPQTLTKGELIALAAMPKTGYVVARKSSPFNGRVMWSLHEKGYVRTPDRNQQPTLYYKVTPHQRSTKR